MAFLNCLDSTKSYIQVMCVVPLGETQAGAVPHIRPNLQFIKSTKPATQSSRGPRPLSVTLLTNYLDLYKVFAPRGEQ